MNKSRRSLRGLIGVMSIFACASAVYAAFLPRLILNPISAFIFTLGLAAGLFLTAGRRRAYLIGFSLTGWAFTGFISEIPYIGGWYLLTLNRVFGLFGSATWQRLGQPDAFIMSFFWIVDALVAIVVAFVGSWLGLLIYRKMANVSKDAQVTRQQGVAAERSHR